MSDLKLERLTEFQPKPGPVLLVIMDGVGLFKGEDEGYGGNAFDRAETPNIDRVIREAVVYRELRAHGTAVGLPGDSDMGNSEVGHNAMGAGRVFEQGAKLVNTALESGKLFKGEVWQELVEQVKSRNSTFHLLGLLSDGNVHSHIDHLVAILDRLATEGVQRIRVHALADGRDVDPVSFERYLERLESLLSELKGRGIDAQVASGGGRMQITMDRYNANWGMVERGWRIHVEGRGRGFPSASEAVEALRAENPKVIDQDLPGFVIVDRDEQPVGAVKDGDALVFFNFRGDRAIEISRAMTESDFQEFDRGPLPDLMYAGMMEYDGDLKIPPKYLVSPPAISKTVSEYLARNGISQLAVAETQKFGHVTYFWNGNNSEKFDKDLETWIEIPSDQVPFETAPRMKAREVCEVVLERLEAGSDRFIRVNFANGDMVGHTGDLEAAITAMETVDECIGLLYEAISKVGGTLVLTADHGNLDMMWEIDKKTGKVKIDSTGDPVIKTSHTLSPVPFAVVGPGSDTIAAREGIADPGIANIAATLLFLLGFRAPSDYLPSLITASR